MFKFKRSDAKADPVEELRRLSAADDAESLNGSHDPDLEEASPEGSGDESGSSESGGVERLATLDRLGQVVVATITVDELSGRDAAELVTELLSQVGSAGIRHFVFDLQNVGYMDSSCIGAMVEMLTRLQQSGGRIALVNPSQSVSYLFKLTKLDRLFPICRDVMMAIAAVERPA